MAGGLEFPLRQQSEIDVTALVESLYRGILQRPSDPGGLQDAVRLLSNAQSFPEELVQYIKGMINSTERPIYVYSDSYKNKRISLSITTTSNTHSILQDPVHRLVSYGGVFVKYIVSNNKKTSAESYFIWFNNVSYLPSNPPSGLNNYTLQFL
jgi:hypothetical protein